MASSHENTTATGACLCRSVKYAVTGQCHGWKACHCLNCKTAGGSEFGWGTVYIDAEMTIEAGQELLKEYKDSNTRSGGTNRRHFCSNCGSPLFSIVSHDGKTMYMLHGGGLESELRAPQSEGFLDRKLDWVGGIVRP